MAPSSGQFKSNIKIMPTQNETGIIFYHLHAVVLTLGWGYHCDCVHCHFVILQT